MSPAESNGKIKGYLEELASRVHPWERGHAERVQVYAVATGDALGMGAEELEELKTAAALHDIGKLEWPEGPWSEPGRVLLAGESDKVRDHAEWGADRLAREGFSEGVCRAVREHHQRADMSGYPSLEGDEMSLSGRVLAVVEFFDGVAFGPWSKKGTDEARNWVVASPPSLFGEDVIEAFLGVERVVQPVSE